jgi:PEP-CTERM motif
MSLKSLGVALCLAGCGFAAQVVQAATITVYDTASFVEAAGGGYKLDGFGRGTSSGLTTGFDALGDLPFFDTWNIDVSAITPGTYNFGPLLVDAAGGLSFTSLTFNSYNEAGVRQTVLFDLNATGTQAVASGVFTVRSNCPVASCVWIDVTGLQPPGGVGAGYGGTTIATVVPEPASGALLALGVAAVLGAVRRRRLHSA